MSNKYNASKTAIIDASGKEWACNIPHPLPLPKGIDPDEVLPNSRGASSVYFADSDTGWLHIHCANHTHWMAKHPMPEAPKRKTQADLDEEAFKNWQHTCGGGWTTRNCWESALYYARKTQPTNR